MRFFCFVLGSYFSPSSFQQSCYRGYRDFVRFVIVQYFIIKIQSIARCYNTRVQFKQQIKQSRETTQKRQRREKIAALIIERFFITVKAEIDKEVLRLATKKNLSQKNLRKLDKTKVAQINQSHKKRNVSSNLSAVTNTGPSQLRPSSQSHGPSDSSVWNGRLDAHLMRGASPVKKRMPSFQSITSTSHEMGGSCQMKNISSVHSIQQIDQFHPLRDARHHMPSRERMHSIQSNGNERLLSQQTNPAHPIRRDMRSASPSREQSSWLVHSVGQNDGHYSANSFTSGHPVPSFQQCHPQSSYTSIDTAQHGGYTRWAPPPSHDNRQPINHPSFYPSNHPQVHSQQAYHDSKILQLNSFTSESHSNLHQHHPHFLASNQSVMTHAEPQMRLSPVPGQAHFSSSYSVATHVEQQQSVRNQRQSPHFPTSHQQATTYVEHQFNLTPPRSNYAVSSNMDQENGNSCNFQRSQHQRFYPGQQNHPVQKQTPHVQMFNIE